MRKVLPYLCLLLFAPALFAGNRFVPPTVPAGNISFTNLEGSSLRINWTNGNGTRRLIIARQGSAVTAVPVDGVDYNSSATFGNGDQILPGQFVVYDNNINNLTDINGLQPNSTYHFAIFEYNGTGAATEYLVTGAPLASQSTITAPVTPASNVVFSNVNGNSMTVSWTNGSGVRRLVLVREGAAVNANPVDLTTYSASTNFGLGTQAGSGNYTIYNSTGTSVNISNLLPNTVYHVSVFEYNGIAQPVYLVTSPATGNQLTLPSPTIPAGNLSFTSVEGASLRVNWSNGNGTRRLIIARQGSPVTAVPVNGVAYNASGTFGNGDAVSPGEFVVYNSNINSLADVNGLQPNTLYHFRIYEYSGSGTNTGYLTSSFVSGSQSTAAAPVTPASNLVFSNVTGNSMTINWTNGNGVQRLVVMKAGSAVDAVPQDLTVYNPSTLFGSGTSIGTGNFVVFRGAGNSVTVSNLQPGTDYHVAVFEFNGNSTPVYNSASPATASQATGLRPTVAAGNVSFNIVEGASMRINWTNGNGTRRIVVAREGSAVTGIPADGVNYAAATIFGNGDAIAPGEFVVYNSNINTLADITGLTPGTTYHFRIFEYSGTGSNVAYLTSASASGSQSTLSAPSIQASNVGFTNITGNSMTISWTNGSGNQRLVLMKAGSAVDASPVNGTPYNASTLFGSGTQLGSGNYTVYRSTGASVTVNNLLPGTSYHVAVFEINGNSSPVYNLVNPATGSQLTGLRPTVAASAVNFNIVDGGSMRINWTNGNGTRRIVIARQGSAVTAVPVDGVDYTASTIFGNGTEIQPGEFVLYNSNINSLADVSGLQPNSTYHFRIYEYSGTGAGTAYLVAAFASASQSTLAAPSVQASSVSFSSITGNSLTAGWTVGNGTQRLVLAREGGAVTASPADLTLYSSNSNFGSGVQLGSGNYIVYRGNGTSVAVTALLPGTTYHFAVFEFNGNTGPVYLRPGATGSATTLGPPQTPAGSAVTGSITTSSIHLDWTNGSGNRRLVLMKAGTAVDAMPTDNGVYTANSFFGSGTQVGTGNFVVFNGAGSGVTVTGLAANITYHFAVFEFNAFGANSQFLLTNPAITSATTSAALPVSFLQFTAQELPAGIQLRWSTAQESNSSHFDVQKSSDGRSFISIGSVQAAGESQQRKDYSFTDPQPVTGINFYRLKQVDKDNQFSYSVIINITYEPLQLLKKIINPVRDLLWLELMPFNSNSAGRREWYLYDIQGKRVMGGRINSTVVRAGMVQLTGGIYILELIVNDRSLKIKIVKH